MENKKDEKNQMTYNAFPIAGNKLYFFILRFCIIASSIISCKAAQPPQEQGNFVPSDLTEINTLDTSIHLDIRYASTNNFAGKAVYKQARAFLQRPAAEALVRVNESLKPLGFGILVFDGYRPWRVTKLFWDITPDSNKRFVADPKKGSRHNRGAAVDCSLYYLSNGNMVTMPGDYDETSARSYPTYTGGTDSSRYHRDILIQAMQANGFTVYEYEWWHFDYEGWKSWPILDIPFRKIKTKQN
ncbi:MAG: M15 family metallopeptidase [Ferruginibacter sp.]